MFGSDSTRVHIESDPWSIQVTISCFRERRGFINSGGAWTKNEGGATFVNLAAKAMNNIKTSVELMEILHGKEEPWPSMAIITLRQCSSGWRNQGVGKN